MTTMGGIRHEQLNVYPHIRSDQKHALVWSAPLTMEYLLILSLVAFVVLMVLATMVMQQRDEARERHRLLRSIHDNAVATCEALRSESMQREKDESRYLQFLLYASRPESEALRRIWWGRDVPGAAKLFLEELGASEDDAPRLTHASYDSASGEAHLEYTPTVSRLQR